MATLGRSPGAAPLTSTDIPDNSITSAKISLDTIVAADLAPNSVDSSELVDGSIDTSHLGNLQVTTGKIAADAIDGTKLADDAVDSEHYTDGSIDNAHLADDAVGVAELSATGTASSSTFLRGDNAWAGTGITAASQWEMGAAVTTADIDISNWVERSDTRLGTIMSEDNAGVFTFPSTGFWLITFGFMIETQTGRGACKGYIRITNNYTAGGSAAWATKAEALQSTADVGDYNYAAAFMSYILDVEATADDKVKFNVKAGYPTTSVSFTGIGTHVTFVRLGDT